MSSWGDRAKFFLFLKEAQEEIPAEELAAMEQEAQAIQDSQQNEVLSQQNEQLQQQAEQASMAAEQEGMARQQAEAEAEQAHLELQQIRQDQMGLSEENKELSDSLFKLKRTVDEYRQGLMDMASEDPSKILDEPSEEEMMEEGMVDPQAAAAEQANAGSAQTPPDMSQQAMAMGKAAAEKLRLIYAKDN